MTTLIDNRFDRGILIIDDDLAFRETLTEYFNNAGYTCVNSASNGTEGLSYLESKGPNIYCIILDLKMPGMDGMEFINHLINVHKQVVGIIMITGYGSLELEKQFFKLGHDPIITSGFFHKPAQFDTIRARVVDVAEQIHQKRMGLVSLSTRELHKRFDKLESKLTQLEVLTELVSISKRIEKKQPGFLAQIGLDLIRAILIAAAVLALLYLDFGSLFRSIISQ